MPRRSRAGDSRGSRGLRWKRYCVTRSCDGLRPRMHRPSSATSSWPPSRESAPSQDCSTKESSLSRRLFRLRKSRWVPSSRRSPLEGFRGIVLRAELELTPGPGLTLVIGRNGSGKSSFAEALEVLLHRGQPALEPAIGRLARGMAEPSPRQTRRSRRTLARRGREAQTSVRRDSGDEWTWSAARWMCSLTA